jgi:hypothetical protein
VNQSVTPVRIWWRLRRTWCNVAFVPIQNLGQIGIISDLPANEIPENAFTSGRNIAFRNNNIEPASGYQQIYSVAGTGLINGLLGIRTPDALKRRWFFCTPSQIFLHLTAATSTDVTREIGIGVKNPYTGTNFDKWTNFAFNGFAYFNNGVDVPQVYIDSPLTIAVQSVDGWDATWRAKSMRAYKNAIVAMNMTEGGVNFPHLLRFSDTAAPGARPTQWTALPTNKAGSIPSAETQGGIIDGEQLGDSFIFYKQDSYYRMTLIGGNDVYRFQKISDSPGLLSPNCVVQYPGGHFCLGNGDVYTHNGGPPTSLLEGRRKEELRALMDVNFLRTAFVTINPQKKECWVCFSSTGSGSPACNRALTWNWETNAWADRDLPSIYIGATGQIDSTIFSSQLINENDESLVIAGVARQLYLVNASKTENGTNMTQTVTRQGLHFGDQLTHKTARAFIPNIVGTPGDVFNFRLGKQNELNDPVTWGPVRPYTLGNSVQVSSIVTGRYHAYEMTTTTANPWQLRSAQYEIESRGRY